MKLIKKLIMTFVIISMTISCSGIIAKACDDCESTDSVRGNRNEEHYYYTNGVKTTTKGWYPYSVNGKKSYVYVGKDGYITNWLIRKNNDSYRYKKWLKGSYKERLRRTKRKRINVANRFYYVNKNSSITMKSGWKTSKRGHFHYVGTNGYVEYTLLKNKRKLTKYNGNGKMVEVTGAIKCKDNIIRYYKDGNLTKASNNMLISCLNDTSMYYIKKGSNKASYIIKNYSSSNPTLYEIKGNGNLAKVNTSVVLRDENNMVVIRTNDSGNVISSNLASLSRTSLSIEVDKSKKLTVSNALGSVVWSSSNSDIATVDSKGNVTGKKAGAVIITASVNGQILNCNVTIINFTPVISKTSASVYEGGYITLSITNASANDTITWVSDSPSKAKVNNSGKVTGVKNGTATIKATVKGVTVSCNVTVKTFTPKLNYTQIKLKVGETQALKVTNNGAGRKVSWLSSTPTIASVNNSGVVSAIKPGTAYISVTTKDVNGTVRTNKCKVDVVSDACEHHFDYDEKDYKYYEQCNACGMIFDSTDEFIAHRDSMHRIENASDAPPGLAYRYKTCTICGKKVTLVIE